MNTPRGSSIATLYLEELKATMRGRFAWLGAAVILLAVGGLATVGTQGGWLDGYGIVAYGLVPLGFLPIAAGMMASPRANRFVECIFTAPVSRSDWLAARFFVLVTLGIAYYLALLPMMLVYAAHVGVPTLLHKYLLWAPGLLLADIAVGSLIGVLFIGRSVAAPIGAAMGVLLAYAACIPLQEMMVAQGNGATRSAHLALISPAVLLKNALGFTLVAPNVPSATRMTWISLAVILCGSLALAAWVFLRAQGVETWEATRAQRWTIEIAILAIAIFPTFFAETNYDNPAPHANNAPAVRLPRSVGYAALVPSAAPAPRRCCSPVLNRNDLWLLPTDRRTSRDLLLLLPIDATKSIANLHATITGADGLDISADPSALNQLAPVLDTRTYPNDSGPVMPDGHRLAEGWVVRIPILLDPTSPWDLGGDRYPLNIAATYDVAGDAQPHTFTQRAAIEAGIANSIYQMALAACILPLCCIGIAFARWRQTR